MDEFNSEREQLEAIKRWFARHGSALVSGLVLGLAVLFGWRYWEESARHSQETASLQFNRLSNALETGDTEGGRTIARELLGSAEGTAYAAFAALALAGLEARAGNWELAAGQLERLIAERPDDPLVTLARTRLAAVYLELGRPADALTQVGPTVSLPNTRLTAETRADVYRALGRFDEARRAYELAASLDPVALVDENSPLALKLDALGGPTPDAAGDAVGERTQAAADELLRLLEQKAALAPATDVLEGDPGVAPPPGGTATAPVAPPATDDAAAESGSEAPGGSP